VPNCNPVVGEAAALSPISWSELVPGPEPGGRFKRGGTEQEEEAQEIAASCRVYARRAKRCKYDKRPRPKFKRVLRESRIGGH